MSRKANLALTVSEVEELRAGLRLMLDEGKATSDVFNVDDVIGERIPRLLAMLETERMQSADLALAVLALFIAPGSAGGGTIGTMANSTWDERERAHSLALAITRRS